MPNRSPLLHLSPLLSSPTPVHLSSFLSIAKNVFDNVSKIIMRLSFRLVYNDDNR